MWFDVVAAPSERSYSIAAFRTGTVRVGAVPGAVPAGASLLSLQDGVIFAAIGWILNRLIFRGAWTVRIAPWYGKRGRRWKVRVSSEELAYRLAEQYCRMIETGSWMPERDPPPVAGP